MIDWKVGDVAIAIESATCSCGEHKVSKGTAYRVHGVACFNPLRDFFDFLGFPPPPGKDKVFLDVLGGDSHYFPHELFRKEQKADKDIFKLCDAPIDHKVLEDA